MSNIQQVKHNRIISVQHTLFFQFWSRQHDKLAHILLQLVKVKVTHCKPLMEKLHDTATECHLPYGITVLPAI